LLGSLRHEAEAFSLQRSRSGCAEVSNRLDTVIGMDLS
jgi:hypothetical protein